jgi:hemerythrin-like metal-binding protein
MSLEWSPIFSVGVEELDRDHKALMTMICEIENLIGSDCDLREALDRYCREMARHAAREIGVLKRYGYEDDGEMAAAHEALAAQFDKFNTMATTGDVSGTIRAWIDYQNMWIKVLTTVSMDYRRYFISKNIIPVVDP